MKTFVLFFSVCLILGLAIPLHAQPVYNPANGHYYEVIMNSSGTQTWSQSSTQAASMSHLGMQGYLATITSDQERDFINSLDWHSATVAWIGGSQVSGQSAPNIGWQWITGEPFLYNGWASNEPNDTDGAEDDTQNCIENARSVGWYDVPCSFEYQHFIVEFSNPVSVQIPTMSEWGMIIFVVLAGLGVIFYLRRQRKATR